MTETPQDFPVFEDARWRRLRDARAAGESLSELDARFVDAHEPCSPDARAEQELMAALVELGAEDDLDTDAADVADTAIVASVVAAYTQQPSSAPSRRIWPWVVGGLAVAAAATVAVALPGPSTSPRAKAPVTANVQTPSAATVVEPDSLDDRHPPAVVAAAIDVHKGTLTRRGEAAPAQPPLLQGVYDVTTKDTCIGRDSARACMDTAASIRVAEDGSIALLSGEARVTVTEPVASVFSLQVAGARYEVESATVAVLSVQRDAPGSTVTVQRGEVVRVSPDGARTSLRAPRVSSKGASKGPRVRGPVADAKTLLSSARSKRAAGDKAGAAKAYAEFVTHYPNEPAAAPTMVTLGELYLAQGKAKQALTWFDRYSKRKGGTLDEEARYGAIRALRKLGRGAAAQRRIDDFLHRYPSSGYASQLR